MIERMYSSIETILSLLLSILYCYKHPKYYYWIFNLLHYKRLIKLAIYWIYIYIYIYILLNKIQHCGNKVCLNIYLIN